MLARATPGVLELKLKALDIQVKRAERAGAQGARLENGSTLTAGAMDALIDYFRPQLPCPLRPAVGAIPRKGLSMRDPEPDDAPERTPTPFHWRYYNLPIPWTDTDGQAGLGMITPRPGRVTGPAVGPNVNTGGRGELKAVPEFPLAVAVLNKPYQTFNNVVALSSF